jgi:hypothetical protein
LGSLQPTLRLQEHLDYLVLVGLHDKPSALFVQGGVGSGDTVQTVYTPGKMPPSLTFSLTELLLIFVHVMSKSILVFPIDLDQACIVLHPGGLIFTTVTWDGHQGPRFSASPFDAPCQFQGSLTDWSLFRRVRALAAAEAHCPRGA